MPTSPPINAISAGGGVVSQIVVLAQERDLTTEDATSNHRSLSHRAEDAGKTQLVLPESILSFINRRPVSRADTLRSSLPTPHPAFFALASLSNSEKMVGLTPQKARSMTVAKLKEELGGRGLSCEGLKVRDRSLIRSRVGVREVGGLPPFSERCIHPSCATSSSSQWLVECNYRTDSVDVACLDSRELCWAFLP